MEKELDEAVENTPEDDPKDNKTSAQERFIQELRDEIAEIRKSHSSDRKKSDEIIGALKAQIEELTGELSGAKKQFEKASQRPKQTLVPPPPPPAPELDKPVPEKGEINTKPRRRWW